MLPNDPAFSLLLAAAALDMDDAYQAGAAHRLAGEVVHRGRSGTKTRRAKYKPLRDAAREVMAESSRRWRQSLPLDPRWDRGNFLRADPTPSDAPRRSRHGG